LVRKSLSWSCTGARRRAANWKSRRVHRALFGEEALPAEKDEEKEEKCNALKLVLKNEKDLTAI